ncbi:hypothetical protein WJX73_009670 [Symbiochloris irregularis]|uniref:Mitochondrial import inner membrane translocase subunit TIM22 n=1 Tax=Symbiochloris irregularis TaxID=706552 RepID=A0AAW1NTT7_9CHLO
MGRRRKPSKGAAQVEPEEDTTSFVMEAGSAPPSISGEEADGFPVPCTLSAIGAAFSGGAMGLFFGFVPTLATYNKKGGFKARLGAAKGEAISSAKGFAVATSIYAMTSCVSQRLRNQNDAWNGAIGGAVSGLAFGWSGGLKGALMSGVIAGALSYLVWSNDAVAAQPPHQPSTEVARRAPSARLPATHILMLAWYPRATG